ncbi:MAG: class IV adenylate cyclase [Pirellulaceae bacterium]
MSKPEFAGARSEQHVEIEAKFAVRDEANLLGRLEACGFRIEQELDQADYYYNHPARDFRETDEAFRIRVSGEDLNLTYKGPRLDSRIKTRSEIELP